MSESYHCAMCELDALMKRYGPDGWESAELRNLFEQGRKGVFRSLDGRTVQAKAWKAGQRAGAIQRLQLQPEER